MCEIIFRGPKSGKICVWPDIYYHAARYYRHNMANISYVRRDSNGNVIFEPSFVDYIFNNMRLVYEKGELNEL